MKKVTISVMAILVLIIFASGCTSNNNTTTGNAPSPQNNSNTQSSSGVVLQINSDASWSGTLTYNNKIQPINGNGNATYNLGQNPGAVSVTLHKTGNAGTISVQIIKDGNVVASQSSSGGQGAISINYSS